MSYTLNRGVEADNSKNIQRGLLIGLPLIALLLSFGSLRDRTSVGNSAAVEPSVIPVVSAAEKTSDDNPGGSANGSSDSAAISTGSSDFSLQGTADSGRSSNYLSSSSGYVPRTGGYSSTPSAGGGAGGASVSTQPSSQPGVLPLDNNVYIPPVNLQADGKPVASSSGTTLYVN